MNKKYDVLWVLGIALPLLILISITYVDISSTSAVQFIFGLLGIISLLPITLFIAMSIQEKRFLVTKKNPWLEATSTLCGCYVVFVSGVFISASVSAGENGWAQLGVTLGMKVIETHFIMIILAFIVSIAVIITNNLYVSLATPVLVLIALISFSSSWWATLPILILSSISSFVVYRSRNIIKNSETEIEL